MLFSHKECVYFLGGADSIILAESDSLPQRLFVCFYNNKWHKQLFIEDLATSTQKGNRFVIPFDL